jgi:hypothetical protein
VPEGATESSQGELYQKRSRGELKEATGRLPTIGKPVLVGPRLHLDQNPFLVFRPRQFGEVALHRVVHPPAHPGL